MIIFIYALTLSTLFSTALLSILALCAKVSKSYDAGDRSAAWLLAVASGPTIFTLILLPLQLKLNIEPLQSLNPLTRRLGIIYAGGELHWLTSNSTLVLTFAAVWMFFAIALFILRSFQLYLSGQFATWSHPIEEPAAIHQLSKAIAKLNVASKVAIRETRILNSPAVVGASDSTILIPQALIPRIRDNDLAAVIAHEMAHVTGRDNAKTFIFYFSEALFWFNPLMYVARRDWSLMRELIADKAALSSTSISPADFAKLLIQLIQQPKQPILVNSVGATRDFQTLKQRLVKMNSHQLPSNSSMSFRTVVAIGLAALLLAPFGATKLLAQSPLKSANLIKNAGFEDGKVGWQEGQLGGGDTRVTTELDSSTFKSGSSSLKFSKSHDSYFPVQLLGQMGIYSKSQTTRLRTRVWVKADQAMKATVAVYFNDDQNSKKIEFVTYVAEPSGGKPLTHDWKQYESVTAVPAGTTNISVHLQMYGKGTVWFDDLEVEYVPDNTPLKSGLQSAPGTKESSSGDPEIDAIKVEDVNIGGDSNKHYKLTKGGFETPPSGKKLVVIMPGGDGSADFAPWIKNVYFYTAEMKGIAFAQMIAPVWDKSDERIVWPTTKSKPANATFTTEEFVRDVIKDASSKTKIDPEHVYVMGWSSGGPPALASLLTLPEVKGAFIAMSVFRPETDLKPAKGKRVFLYQSPNDQVTRIFWATKAKKELTDAGGKTELLVYFGGHGWTGDSMKDISTAFEFLIKR